MCFFTTIPHSGIKNNKSLWALGVNYFGELGNGTFTTNTNIPIQIGNELVWESIAAGDRHSVALKDDGTIWGWGYGYFGLYGNNDLSNYNIPMQLGNVNDWSSILSNFHNILAKKNNGTLWAWGGNASSTLITQFGVDSD